MSRAYHQVLPYAQKRFSALSAVRNALPTAWYALSRPALPAGQKPILFTSTIFAPNAVVWHHFVQKYLGEETDMFIFDCGGRVDPADVPAARVQRLANFMHPTKIDWFLKITARNRNICWICDDDMYPVSRRPLEIIRASFEKPHVATVSFRPRTWWHFEIEGKRYEPTGSYCFALRRDIFTDTEHLSFRAADGNTHPSHIEDRPMSRYDTGDKANELLLRKGYECVIVPEEEREQCVTGFTGVSGAALLLSYFRKPKDVIDFYLSPPRKQWSGTVLFGTFQSMLSLRAVLTLYETITGKRYDIPSLPSDTDLHRIRAEATPHLRDDQSFDDVDEHAKRLLALL